MKRKRKKSSKYLTALLTFQLVLIALVFAAVGYVHSLLVTFEANHKDNIVSKVVEDDMIAKVQSDSFFENELVIQPGKFENKEDIIRFYKSAFLDPETKYEVADSDVENEFIYIVKSKDDVDLAEITLTAVGDPVTKLAVFSWQECEVKSYRFILEPKTYTLSLPADFSVNVNGLPLTAEEGVLEENGSILYTLKDLYLTPQIELTNRNGEKADYSINNEKIIPVFYDYSLTLPSSLTVTLNGEIITGEKTDEGHKLYDVFTVKKPELVITDLFGNSVRYEGGNTLPLSVMNFKALSTFTVTVDGSPVPAEFVSYTDNPEYAKFSDYVSNLPKIAEYNITVLSDSPEIVITDPNGVSVSYQEGTDTLDLVEVTGEDSIPAEIAAEVDPLAIAKKWSLFVSKDLPGQSYGLYDIAQHLISGSYQYTVATNYAYGIDITFTSNHVLLDPPFTDETVSNFIRITDNCFSVDVSFRKHMLLADGQIVIDAMSERLYFVKYDDPNEAGNNPTWKLASMKEMSTNAE